MMAGLFLLLTIDILLIMARKRTSAVVVLLATLILCLSVLIYHGIGEPIQIQL